MKPRVKPRGEWVKCWSHLREGDKRGLSRATRFIYLELSLEARKLRGQIVLGSGMSDIRSIVDLLSGNRREVERAVEELSRPLDPTDPECKPMIRFEGPRERRILIVESWTRWNALDDSSERVTRHRAETAKKRVTSETSNGHVTRYTVPEKHVTPPVRNEADDRYLQGDLDLEREKERDLPEPKIPAPVEPRRRGRPKKTDPHVEASAHQAVMETFQRCFMATHDGQKPIIGARQGAAAKRMLADMPLAAAIDCIESAFADIWFARKSADLTAIAANPNRWRGVRPLPFDDLVHRRDDEPTPEITPEERVALDRQMREVEENLATRTIHG